MVILGAGGHAKEILELILEDDSKSNIAIFDNISPTDNISNIFKKFTVLRSLEDLNRWFIHQDSDYIIGVGGIKKRAILRRTALNTGGSAITLVANNAVVGNYDVYIGLGTTIMQLVFVSNSVKIGKEVLINTRANIHHDVNIGDYSEIGPNALILGNVEIGKNVFIGAGTTILPKLKIGDNCTIGAGAVVTRNIADNMVVKGNPAK